MSLTKVRPTDLRKNLVIIAFVTATLLLVPLTAMQFTSEVAWSVGDFIIAGLLLFLTGAALDITTRKAPRVYRKRIGAGIIVVFLLLWIELAVGIFN